MTGDHPTDWALRYVQAKTLRDAAADLRNDMDPDALRLAPLWLDARADELEQR